jgi:pimeloyl-ACP methyl ester carboxylesterase
MYIHYQNNCLHYVRNGNGSTPLLLFHGFGQSHKLFDEWVLELSEKYTLFSFDLFFHGQSEWTSEQPLEKTDVATIINLFLAQEGIVTFAIAGFSLGGKFAMTTLELFSEKVKKVFLLAPDGVKTSAWYSLATYPLATRKLFKSMIEKPERFFKLIKIARSLGVVDNGIIRFVENQMNTKAKREQVYNSWVYFRHIKVDIDIIASLLKRNSIPLLMLVGNYDKVILANNMNLLLDKVLIKQFYVLEAGHNDLVSKSAGYML